MLSAYGRTKMKRETLWHDFVNAFRPHKIRSWYRPMMNERYYLPANRGTQINSDRNRALVDSRIEVH